MAQCKKCGLVSKARKDKWTIKAEKLIEEMNKEKILFIKKRRA